MMARGVICFLVGLLTVFVGANKDGRVIMTSKTCPDPFVFVGSKCFWFYRGRSTVDRTQAHDLCESAGGRLAQVTDEATQMGLQKWIDGHEFRLTSYWLGLRDENGNGEFRWDQGNDDASFTSWGEGQPEQATVQSCVVMSARQDHNWESAGCDEHHLFICEKDAPPRNLLRMTVVKSFQQFCDYRTLGYYADPTNCERYILCFGRTMYRYSCPRHEVFNPHSILCGPQGANTFCRNERPPPTTTTTTVESTLPTDPDDYGIDGGEYPEGDLYAGGEEPDDTVEGCEHPSYGEEDEDIGDFPGHTCDDGYAKLGKKCYRIFFEPVSWNVANQICIGDEGGRLVAIKARREQEFILDHLKRSTEPVYDFWIGLNDQKTEDRYIWSDGSVLCNWNYENWSKKARKRHSDIKKCVQMAKILKGLWDDAMCSNENGYICEKDAIDPAATDASESMTESVEGLPPGWKSRNTMCGTNRRPHLPEAVIGGEIADISEHPWQASLRSFGQHRCGGTLIDSCWMLTAAHCVDARSTGRAKRPTLVVLGDADTSAPEGTEEYLPIKRIILHPDWTARPVPTNDIALVELRICVSNLNPICLPGRDFDEFAAGDVCKVAGWGTMDKTRSRYPSRLQEAKIPIISSSICERKYTENRRTLINTKMFCAGFLRGGVDACQGDSGGPLSCKGARFANRAVQWGIVSWGFGCAQKNRPGVYTRVASYMDWIRNNSMIDF